MKKAVTIAFLLLVNILVLAHAVVPHHDNSIADCLPDSLCACADKAQDDKHGDATSQDHNCCPFSDDCTIGIYAESDNNIIKASSCHTDCNCGQSYYFIIPWFPDVPGLTGESGFPFLQKPYLSTYHSVLTARSNGLRAPPVC